MFTNYIDNFISEFSPSIMVMKGFDCSTVNVVFSKNTPCCAQCSKFPFIVNSFFNITLQFFENIHQWRVWLNLEQKNLIHELDLVHGKDLVKYPQRFISELNALKLTTARIKNNFIFNSGLNFSNHIIFLKLLCKCVNQEGLIEWVVYPFLINLVLFRLYYGHTFQVYKLFFF